MMNNNYGRVNTGSPEELRDVASFRQTYDREMIHGVYPELPGRAPWQVQNASRDQQIVLERNRLDAMRNHNAHNITDELQYLQALREREMMASALQEMKRNEMTSKTEDIEMEMRRRAMMTPQIQDQYLGIRPETSFPSMGMSDIQLQEYLQHRVEARLQAERIEAAERYHLMAPQGLQRVDFLQHRQDVSMGASRMRVPANLNLQDRLPAGFNPDSTFAESHVVVNKRLSSHMSSCGQDRYFRDNLPRMDLRGSLEHSQNKSGPERSSINNVMRNHSVDNCKTSQVSVQTKERERMKVEVLEAKQGEDMERTQGDCSRQESSKESEASKATSEQEGNVIDEKVPQHEENDITVNEHQSDSHSKMSDGSKFSDSGTSIGAINTRKSQESGIEVVSDLGSKSLRHRQHQNIDDTSVQEKYSGEKKKGSLIHLLMATDKERLAVEAERTMAQADLVQEREERQDNKRRNDCDREGAEEERDPIIDTETSPKTSLKRPRDDEAEISSPSNYGSKKTKKSYSRAESKHLVSKWHAKLEELKAYKEREGHCNVPLRDSEGGFLSLGTWLKYQRAAYKGKGHPLTQERIDLLNSLGVQWHVRVGKRRKKRPEEDLKDKNDQSREKTTKSEPNEAESKDSNIAMVNDAWHINFNKLKKIWKKEGHCSVPLRDSSYRFTKLGTWLRTQRKAHARDCLSEEKVEMLESLDIVWDPNSHPENRGNKVKWDKKFRQLKAYKKKYGDCNVSTYDDEYKQLGSWLDRQRTSYKKMKKTGRGRMTADQIEKLESLGVEWFLYRKSKEEFIKSCEEV